MLFQFGTDAIQKVVKFGLVGLSGMLVDFSITYLCKEKLKWDKYLSNSIGFSLAVFSNFFLNYYFTFNPAQNNMATTLELFIGIAMVGLLLNNLFIYVFTDISMNFYIAKCIAIGLVFLWNFSANYLFNFH